MCLYLFSGDFPEEQGAQTKALQGNAKDYGMTSLFALFFNYLVVLSEQCCINNIHKI
jgi:hypothetical protein